MCKSYNYKQNTSINKTAEILPLISISYPHIHSCQGFFINKNYLYHILYCLPVNMNHFIRCTTAGTLNAILHSTSLNNCEGQSCYLNHYTIKSAALSLSQNSRGTWLHTKIKGSRQDGRFVTLAKSFWFFSASVFKMISSESLQLPVSRLVVHILSAARKLCKILPVEEKNH